MRVLAVTPYYSPEGGGLERYAHEVLSRMAQAGHEVRVLSFTRQKPGQSDQDGVRIRRFAAPFVLGNTPIDPAFADRTRRMIKEFDPDVMLAHTPVPFPAQAAFFAAKRAGVPFVPTYHAGRLRGGSRALDAVAALDRATFERSMLAQSARLVAVGPFVRDNALARERDRVTVVPPGVDAHTFRPGPTPEDKEILFVGPLDRAYRWKGLDVLWDAFRHVKQAVPEARLKLVGTGDRVPELTVKAREFDGAVSMPGRLDEAGLVQAYQRSAATVLPSTTEAESFGMALAEANACGRPVVASDIGGIPDFVRDGDNGLLAPPGDAEALAARLVRILEDPQEAEAMGRRGRQRVVREHDWDDLAEATMKVLQEARHETVPMQVRRGAPVRQVAPADR